MPGISVTFLFLNPIAFPTTKNNDPQILTNRPLDEVESLGLCIGHKLGKLLVYTVVNERNLLVHVAIHLVQVTLQVTQVPQVVLMLQIKCMNRYVKILVGA